MLVHISRPNLTLTATLLHDVACEERPSIHPPSSVDYDRWINNILQKFAALQFWYFAIVNAGLFLFQSWSKVRFYRLCGTTASSSRPVCSSSNVNRKSTIYCSSVASLTRKQGPSSRPSKSLLNILYRIGTVSTATLRSTRINSNCLFFDYTIFY